MLYAAALFALLVLAAWISIGGDGGQENIQPCTTRLLQPCQVEESHREILSGEPVEGLPYLFPRCAVAEALDAATPDRLMRGLLDPGPDIRVAGAGVVVETEFIRERLNVVSPRIGAPPAEGAIGELFYLSIYCCLNDPGGAYCGFTASGVQVAPGMAACSTHWNFGQQFVIGETWLVTCFDRGSAVTQTNHLDVHFDDCGQQQDPAPGTGWAWLSQVGTAVPVEVVR